MVLHPVSANLAVHTKAEVLEALVDTQFNSWAELASKFLTTSSAKALASRWFTTWNPGMMICCENLVSSDESKIRKVLIIS